MLTRIVKMQFNESFIEEFILLFEAVQIKIKNSEGCTGVSLLRNSADPTLFFTISYWEDEAALNNYRNSSLFTSTWATVKLHFSSKAEAWSLNSI